MRGSMTPEVRDIRLSLSLTQAEAGDLLGGARAFAIRVRLLCTVGWHGYNCVYWTPNPKYAQ